MSPAAGQSAAHFAHYLVVMHRKDVPMNVTLRYWKATFITTMAASIVPACISSLFFFNAQNHPVEASEAQGMLFFGSLFVAALCFTAFAFPLTAFFLQRKGQLVKRHYYKSLFILLALTCIGLTAIISFTAKDISFLVFAPAYFAIIALLSLPFRPLWFKLAQNA